MHLQAGYWVGMVMWFLGYFFGAAHVLFIEWWHQRKTGRRDDVL